MRPREYRYVFAHHRRRKYRQWWRKQYRKEIERSRRVSWFRYLLRIIGFSMMMGVTDKTAMIGLRWLVKGGGYGSSSSCDHVL